MIGEKYTRIKTTISECFQNRNSASLETLLREQDKDRSFPYLMMALYKNVTTLFKEVENVPVELFNPLLTKLYPMCKQDWQPFLANSLSHNLKITNENWDKIETNLLLVQLKFSIMHSKSKFIKPLAYLINSPKEFKNSFIPCMPQDSLFDIHNAIRVGNAQENPTFYGIYLPFLLFMPPLLV